MNFPLQNTRETPQKVVWKHQDSLKELLPQHKDLISAMSAMAQAYFRTGGMSEKLETAVFPSGKTTHFLNRLRQTAHYAQHGHLFEGSTDVASWLQNLDILQDAVWQGAEVKPALSKADNVLSREMFKLRKELQSSELHATLQRAYRIGRSARALEIPKEDLEAHLLTQIYVEYLVSRRNVRRAFSTQGIEGTRDILLEGLHELLIKDEGTRWDVISKVQPSPSVLRRLPVEDQLEQLVFWFGELKVAAKMLEKLNVCPAKKSMRSEYGWRVIRKNHSLEPIAGRKAVSPGDNSWGWNTAARWYNTSRDNWLAVLTALGWVDETTAEFMPPKAMRVMAADLVRWQQEEHPDVKMAKSLPWPWEAVSGDLPCGRELVEQTGQKLGVDAAATGWSVLRGKRDVAMTVPAPELVHGVIVQDPELAALLRKSGVFGGNAKTTAQTIQITTLLGDEIDNIRATHPTAMDELRARFSF